MKRRKLAATTLAVAMAAGLMAAASTAAYAGPPVQGHGGGPYYGGGVHCVKYGETLYGIAWRYGVSAHALAAHNGLYNPNYIRAGQCLRIPTAGGGYGPGHGYTPKPPAPPAYHPGPGHYPGYPGGKMYGRTYCVQYGDTLFSIARRYGTNAWAIARANGIHNPNYIRAGQCLYIPGY